MRTFCFGLFVFSSYCQQPPDNNHALQKPVDLMQAIAKLRDNYQKSVNSNFEAMQAQLLQKSEIASDISQTEFGCIIDHENDSIILKKYTRITELILKMNELEQNLEKVDASLTQNPKNVLELWAEHETQQEIEAVQKEIFEAIMQLSYHQTIRTHQKASAVRGAVVKIAKN